MPADPLAEIADAAVDDLQQLADPLVEELGGADPTVTVDGLEGQLDAAGMPTLEHNDPFAPMQHMYDEQLEMLLNPYAAPPGMILGPQLMPPGLGPMGPMPGPGM